MNTRTLAVLSLLVSTAAPSFAARRVPLARPMAPRASMPAPAIARTRAALPARPALRLPMPDASYLSRSADFEQVVARLAGALTAAAKSKKTPEEKDPKRDGDGVDDLDDLGNPKRRGGGNDGVDGGGDEFGGGDRGDSQP